MEGAFLMPVNLKCPKCSGTNYVRCGRSKAGTQRYLCKICYAKFSDTNDTVMFSKKLDLSTWYSMINLMINDTKLKAIIDLLHISSKTAYLWRMKIYAVTEKLRKDVILEGNVWIDEKYVHVNKSIVVMKEGTKEYRGLSRN